MTLPCSCISCALNLITLRANLPILGLISNCHVYGGGDASLQSRRHPNNMQVKAFFMPMEHHECVKTSSQAHGHYTDCRVIFFFFLHFVQLCTVVH